MEKLTHCYSLMKDKKKLKVGKMNSKRCLSITQGDGDVDRLCYTSYRQSGQAHGASSYSSPNG